MSSVLEKESDRVIVAAGAAIRDRMEIGSLKYDPSSWRDESVRRHVYRAIKHLTTAMEILEGEREPDGEDHFSAGVCRSAMALVVANQPAAVKP